MSLGTISFKSSFKIVFIKQTKRKFSLRKCKFRSWLLKIKNKKEFKSVDNVGEKKTQKNDKGENENIIKKKKTQGR